MGNPPRRARRDQTDDDDDDDEEEGEEEEEDEDDEDVCPLHFPSLLFTFRMTAVFSKRRSTGPVAWVRTALPRQRRRRFDRSPSSVADRGWTDPSEPKRAKERDREEDNIVVWPVSAHDGTVSYCVL